MNADVMRNKYRELSEDDKRQMRELKDFGNNLHGFLDGLTPGREISLAKTKLEEAIMWATKSITG